jgi:hypothetical protein
MMISQPAWWCLEAAWQRLRGRHESLQLDVATDTSAASTVANEAEHEGFTRYATSGLPSLPQSAEPATRLDDPAGPLTAAERRARAAALRALALGRGRRFDSARAAFTDAARLDPSLDLTRTPAFWKLERAAHEAAIDAYVAVGRDRDAAVLRARVRSTFRPKALRARQEPVLNP